MRGPRAFNRRTLSARSLWNSTPVDPGLVVTVMPVNINFTNPGNGNAEEGTGIDFSGQFPTFGLLTKYAIVEPEAVLRREMEDGTSKTSTNWSRILVAREVTYLYRSKSSYLAFIDWFNNLVNKGESWFDWTDPTTGTVKVARIKDGKLGAERPLDPLMTWWTIDMTLEVWDD